MAILVSAKVSDWFRSLGQGQLNWFRFIVSRPICCWNESWLEIRRIDIESCLWILLWLLWLFLFWLLRLLTCRLLSILFCWLFLLFLLSAGGFDNLNLFLFLFFVSCLLTFLILFLLRCFWVWLKSCSGWNDWVSERVELELGCGHKIRGCDIKS